MSILLNFTDDVSFKLWLDHREIIINEIAYIGLGYLFMDMFEFAAFRRLANWRVGGFAGWFGTKLRY